MNIIKYKLNMFNADNFSFCIQYLDCFGVSLFAMLVNLIWRGQISATQDSNSIRKIDLQGVPSMKFTAKMFNSEILIHKLLCTISISETSYLEHQEYTNTPLENRLDFVKKKIEDLLPNGKAKILNPRQIANYEDIMVHRRGLVAKYRGLLQSQSLYKPSNLIIGINIRLITWKQFISGFINFLDYIKFPVSKTIIQMHNYCAEMDILDQLPKIDENKGEAASLSAYGTVIFKQMAMGCLDVLKFEDGILVGSETDNRCNMEKCLRLERNFPQLIISIDPQMVDADDPFIKASLKSQSILQKRDSSLFRKKSTRKRVV